MSLQSACMQSSLLTNRNSIYWLNHPIYFEIHLSLSYNVAWKRSKARMKPLKSGDVALWIYVSLALPKNDVQLILMQIII